MSCVKDFRVEIQEQTESTIKAKIVLVQQNGDTSETIEEFVNTPTSSAQTQFSNRVTAIWGENTWCDAVPVESTEPEINENSLLGAMKKKNALLKQQNDLIADQTKAIRAHSQNNSTARAVKEQTQKQEIHNQVATEKNKAFKDELDFNKSGTDTVLDTAGNKVIPREVKAQNHAEQNIENIRSNTTDIMPFINSFHTQQNDTESDTNIMTGVLNDLFAFDSSKIKTSQLEVDEKIEES